MTPDDTRAMVPLYILGELEGRERAEFEAMLARSPELEAEVRECTDALAAAAGDPELQLAPPRRVWRGIERSVRSERHSAPTKSPTRARAATRREKPSRIFWPWPVAAALLLVLNLAQWFESREWPALGGTKAGESVLHSSPQPDAGDAAVAKASDHAQSARGDGTRLSARGSSGSLSVALAQALSQNQKLTAENRKLAADYAALSDVVVPLLSEALRDSHHGQLWAVQMRATGTGQSSAAIGLWDRVRSMVPETGVAALPDRWRVAPGLIVDPAAWPRNGMTVPLFGPGMAPADGRQYVWMPVATAGQGGQPPPPAFAMALINGEERLGYVDLYNLPVVADGQELMLWMKDASAADYRPVGAIPSGLAGGSGSLVFRMPTEVADPSELLISVEPAAAGVGQPSSRIILQGP